MRDKESLSQGIDGREETGMTGIREIELKVLCDYISEFGRWKYHYPYKNPLEDLRVRGSMGKGVYRELMFSFKRSRLRCLWNKYSNGDFQ